MSELIPSGRHRGKSLDKLSDQHVIALYSSWKNSRKLREKPFFELIFSEIGKRGYSPGDGNSVVRTPKSPSKRQAKAVRRLERKKSTVEGIMHAVDAFQTTKAEETVAYQNKLLQHGEMGQLAFGLFRAQKRSTKAKGYRGKLRRASYDGKNDALRYLDSALTLWGDELGIDWGWKIDPAQDFHNKVLYVELPEHGQCSFHSQDACSGKRFEGQWDRSKTVLEVVLDFCDFVVQTEDEREMRDVDLMPFGKHVGSLLGEIDGGYWNWLADWDGLSNWSALEPFIKARVS